MSQLQEINLEARYNLSRMPQKKQIFKLSILKKFLNDANSCVSLVTDTRLLALPPFFLNDMKSGIFYLLNSILKKYDRSLDGIVIGYQNVKILMDENTGIIPIGSAETEVNVSVEFYIFQPKIGNTLEGVINKKSNNHIGCLVHRYFNATILKPEDVEYKDWNCKQFDVNDKIVFKVKDLDFTGLLPYIEGIVNTEDVLSSAKSRRTDGCDLDVHVDFQGVTESTRLMDASLGSEKGQSQINGTVGDLLQQELNKVKKKLNKSEKKEKKNRKSDDSLYEKLMEEVKSEISPEKNKDSYSMTKKKKKKKPKEKFKNGSMYDIDLSPEKTNADKSNITGTDQSSVRKENVNGVASAKKSLIQTMLDQFFKEEGKKLKGEPEKKSVKESRGKKRDRKPTKETESLYEQLLNEARSRIEVSEDSPPRKKRKTK